MREETTTAGGGSRAQRGLARDMANDDVADKRTLRRSRCPLRGAPVKFRYSSLEDARPPSRYTARRRRDGETFPCGHGEHNLWVSYVHAHWASAPAAAEHLVSACQRASAGL